MVLIVPTTPTTVKGGEGRAAALDLLADRVLVPEVAIHEVLVDDDDRRALGGVASSNSRPLTSGICIARK